MTWIKTIDLNDVEGELKTLYDQVKTPSGHIDNILKAHSLRPRTLVAHLALYKATIHTKPNALSPRERELVGVWVSRLNGCDYCVEHHRAGLARHLGSARLALELSAAIGKQASTPLTQREQALCAYATKLTKTPAQMEARDLDVLRNAGLDDAGILDLNQIVAYFAYANRTVLGLGVSIDGEPLGLHPDENEEGFKHQ
ncbi:peroxidase-related enzyme [Candidatus Acetothermia bacterium]|nr:peroxidase-related enzyme [Candidatus Acetothermia bacterium]MBI3460699.1 peroxidase-related enzyme [Candidatus Acetothermia bacterium]